MAEPYPKSRQLARGERRYRRKIASQKQWAAIRADKEADGCRIGWSKAHRNTYPPVFHLHHLVPRHAPYFGDDIADNIIALCPTCHDRVTRNERQALAMVAASLTDGEYTYIIGRLGEDGPRRLFGV